MSIPGPISLYQKVRQMNEAMQARIRQCGMPPHEIMLLTEAEAIAVRAFLRDRLAMPTDGGSAKP